MKEKGRKNKKTNTLKGKLNSKKEGKKEKWK